MTYTIDCANKLESEKFLFRIAILKKNGYTIDKVLYFITYKDSDYFETYQFKGWSLADLQALHTIIEREKHTFPTLIRRCIRSINKFKKERNLIQG